MANRTLIMTALLTSGAAVFAQSTIIGANGTAGYVDMPSAFAPPEGETSFTYYQSDLVTGKRLQFQASESLSLGVDFSDDKYTGTDTSFDLKYQILQNDGWVPAVAIGFNDMFGIGPRSSEYIVASQEFGDFDLSLGLGWGVMGGYEPLNDETARTVDKHQFSTDHFFSGPMAAFAGAAWRTPIEGLSLTAEYSTLAWDQAVADGFEREEWSAGIQYRKSDRWALNAFTRNGNDFGFSITLAGNPYKPVTPQNRGGAPIALYPRSLVNADRTANWAQIPGIGAAMGTGMTALVEAEGYELVASRVTGDRIDLEIRDGKTHITPKIIGRIMRTLGISAPGSVETFSVAIVNQHDIPTSRVVMNRTELENLADDFDVAAKTFAAATIEGAPRLNGDGVYRADVGKRFSFGGGVSTDINFFDDSTGLGIKPYAHAKYRMGNGFSVNANASFNLQEVDTTVTPSTIGVPVRSDLALYKQDFVTLDRLTADYQVKVGGDIYGRLSLGLLETQFAGIDAEIVYAPPSSPIAVGIEVAQVTKRDPDTIAGLGDYETTTGHATLYWDTGYKGIEASASYGKYLAGDWGSTATLARKFANGWRVEGSLTATDHFNETEDTRNLVPSLSVSIPLQWTMPRDTRAEANIGIAGSTGDAGARLNIANRIYDDIRDYDAADYKLRWGGFWL